MTLLFKHILCLSIAIFIGIVNMAMIVVHGDASLLSHMSESIHHMRFGEWTFMFILTFVSSFAGAFSIEGSRYTIDELMPRSPPQTILILLISFIVMIVSTPTTYLLLPFGIWGLLWMSIVIWWAIQVSIGVLAILNKNRPYS